MTFYDLAFWSWNALVIGDFVGRPLLRRWRHQRALRQERQYLIDALDAALRRYEPPKQLSGPHR